jgi:hypothetical protein
MSIITRDLSAPDLRNYDYKLKNELDKYAFRSDNIRLANDYCRSKVAILSFNSMVQHEYYRASSAKRQTR